MQFLTYVTINDFFVLQQCRPEILVDVHQALEHPLPASLMEFLPPDQTTDHGGSVSDNVFEMDSAVLICGPWILSCTLSVCTQPAVRDG
jgi:hypothetical protein